MLGYDGPKIEAKDWLYTRISAEKPEYLINGAPVDGLLAMFHSAAKGGTIGPTKLEFLTTLLEGRYAEAQIESMNRLTEALNRASKSSTFVGWVLIGVGIVSVVVAFLGYLK